ncbi:hypothetical protein HY793_01275 [Candidatus Desantisbacteria bacterium]|nr:hypothetical protein [Candidatus Desantisbacteria bacterium]
MTYVKLPLSLRDIPLKKGDFSKKAFLFEEGGSEADGRSKLVGAEAAILEEKTLCIKKQPLIMG